MIQITMYFLYLIRKDLPRHPDWVANLTGLEDKIKNFDSAYESCNYYFKDIDKYPSIFHFFKSELFERFGNKMFPAMRKLAKDIKYVGVMAAFNIIPYPGFKTFFDYIWKLFKDKTLKELKQIEIDFDTFELGVQDGVFLRKLYSRLGAEDKDKVEEKKIFLTTDLSDDNPMISINISSLFDYLKKLFDDRILNKESGIFDDSKVELTLFCFTGLYVYRKLEDGIPAASQARRDPPTKKISIDPFTSDETKRWIDLVNSKIPNPNNMSIRCERFIPVQSTYNPDQISEIDLVNEYRKSFHDHYNLSPAELVSTLKHNDVVIFILEFIDAEKAYYDKDVVQDASHQSCVVFSKSKNTLYVYDNQTWDEATTDQKLNFRKYLYTNMQELINSIKEVSHKYDLVFVRSQSANPIHNHTLINDRMCTVYSQWVPFFLKLHPDRIGRVIPNPPGGAGMFSKSMRMSIQKGEFTEYLHNYIIETIENSPAFSRFDLKKDLPEIDTLKDDPSYGPPTLKPLIPDSDDEEEESEVKKRPRDSSGSGYFRIDLGGGKIYHVKKYSHDQKNKLRNKLKNI